MVLLTVVGPSGQCCDFSVSSLHDLKRNCAEVFHMKSSTLRIELDDHTDIDDDYFCFLGDKMKLFAFDQVSVFLSHIFPKLEEFISRHVEKNFVLMKCLNTVSQSGSIEKILQFLDKLPRESPYLMASKKANHPEWFFGLDTKYRTKEAYLRNSAERRVRSYLQTAKEELKEEKNGERVLSYFKSKLQEKCYNMCYFDRTAINESLCDQKGLFRCEGRYNECSCGREHWINPYNSREECILFSKWNLDHVIEKSRTVLPTLKMVLQNSRKDINLDYFFDLMFVHRNVHTSCGNLKIVHPVCHVIQQHENKCDQSKVYL